MRNELELEDYDSLSLEANHELGRAHVRAGRYFPAHEAWETAWKQARGTDDAEFFKGLSQMGAGYVHLLRGNAHGAKTLLRRASRRIHAYPDGHHGVATTVLSEKLEAETMKLANELADRSPAALKLGLLAFYRSQDMELEPQLRYLQTELGRVLALEDAAEGIMAFLQKRKPVWKGR